MPEDPPAGTARPLVRVRGLRKHFPVHTGLLRRQTGVIKALDGITFDILEGETLGLVGESGSGKSTAGRSILRLYDVTSGTVELDGAMVSALSGPQLRALRPKMQMIFQDPQACLNPRMTVGSIISEPLEEHGRLDRAGRRRRVAELMDAVGLQHGFANRYPHEFSGGQRQRIGIARALALSPQFVICDEPIAALDVSIQAQVVNLLEDLQAKMGLTYLFISHDLSMVRHLADRVAVMYLGRLAELARSEDLYSNPQHPYTRALLSAIPRPEPPAASTREERTILKGDVPSPANPPKGCPFCTRCPVALDLCHRVVPEWREVRPGHYAACHRIDEEEGAPQAPPSESMPAVPPADPDRRHTGGTNTPN